MKNKTKPCDYCHRLPLRAGGCNLLCIKGGWKEKPLMIEIELDKQLLKLAKKTGENKWD